MFSTAFRHLPLPPLILINILQFVASLDPPYGKLSVKGTQLVGSDGQPVALHGMSLFWSQFPTGSGFYNKETVQTLKCKWNCNVVRAAMGIEVVSKELPWPGYLDNPTGEQAKVEAVVEAAIELGIYVIIDWHDHNAVLHPDAAVQFFANISAKYAKYPHIIYETYNEPQGIPTANQQGLPKYNWTQVKEYHERVVPAIRQNDPDNVIVLGTPTWSRDVDVASRDPLKGSNLMYTLHYYAATHKQWLRDKAQVALDNGLPLFVSEYGNLRDTGDGNVDYVSAQEWWVFLEQRNISYVDWTVEVGTNCLKVNSTTLDVPDSDLTEVGYLAKMKLRSLDNVVKWPQSIGAIQINHPCHHHHHHRLLLVPHHHRCLDPENVVK